MSVGKNSLARVASVTAKKEQPATEQVVETVASVPAEPAAEVSAPAKEAAAPEIKADEKFKNVQVGDDMPAFLL